MSGDRPRYGSLVSALGAIVLAIAVFLPWYGLSFTPSGLAYIQQVDSQAAARFGNSALQGYMSALHTRLSGLAGHEFVSVSAHQALSTLNVVLLILAGLAVLVSLLALAGATDRNGSVLALLGVVAAICVGYRIVHPPSPAASLVALSLREGAWLALLGSLAIVAGAAWPGSRRTGTKASRSGSQDVWSELSGWTPET